MSGSTTAIRQYPPLPTQAPYTAYNTIGTTTTINLGLEHSNAGYGYGIYPFKCSTSVINSVAGVFDYI